MFKGYFWLLSRKSQKSGGGFFQNCGLTEFIFNVSVKYRWPMNGYTYTTDLIVVPKCPYFTALGTSSQEAAVVAMALNSKIIKTIFPRYLSLLSYWQNCSDMLVIYHACLYWLCINISIINILLKPLSQWEVSSGDLELTRCKSTVKAICVGLANSANYPDQ